MMVGLKASSLVLLSVDTKVVSRAVKSAVKTVEKMVDY